MVTIDRVRDKDALLKFSTPKPVMTRESADSIVADILTKWQMETAEEALRVSTILADEFPDQEPPDGFWHDASSVAFRDFFVWGHNHNFGHGISRAGAMSSRHIEITAEALELGMLPARLDGKKVLDVGCWSGGDLLVLAGLGGQVTCVEEHPIAARAAHRLAALLGLDAPVIEASLYKDRPDWAGKFDYVYCSGVIYHVTDPLLFLRILFAYLKPGGEVFLETKAVAGEGSVCGYSGTMEKGWNWYAPNETALGRWMVDAGFEPSSIRIYRRFNDRLLAYGRKAETRSMRETAGFSRPGSWLEGVV
ncbi:MAG: class I SAM-dependent methyltransferase [Desulfuromonadaceae bacterium]|nr:class I SAM-dependent methyltransferase [Desulfuromonadaceae bacterium]